MRDAFFELDGRFQTPSPSTLVARLYRAILGREPTSGELGDWRAMLAQGATEQTFVKRYDEEFVARFSTLFPAPP